MGLTHPPFVIITENMKKIYATKYSRIIITLERGGVQAEIEFKNGRMNDNVNGKFITSDPFLQYLIEHDSRYGSLFWIDKTIPEANEEKPADKRKAKENVETVVDTVTDLVGAIDWFAERGKALTTEKQVCAAMKSMNVKFPNWKTK